MIRVHQLSSRATQEQRLDVMLGFDTAAHALAVRNLWELGLYDCVAHVHSGGMDTAFRCTNTVDQYWWEDPQYVPTVVTPSFDGPGCRSTSVGDVLTVDSEPVSLIHVVASVGFTSVRVGPPRKGRPEDFDHLRAMDGLPQRDREEGSDDE